MNLISLRTQLARVPRRAAFTLVEMIAVVAIMVVLLLLVAPSFMNINRAGDITKATYDVSGAIQTARAYATANDTYVWLGFFEEDVSRFSSTPASAGTGRIVMSMVASGDGTMIYNSSTLSSASGTAAIPGTSLVQLTKLAKINNMHLVTASGSNSIFPTPSAAPPSSSATLTFDSRPSISGTTAQIGDNPAFTSSPTQFLFQYPLTAATASAQYKFNKVIQFNPRGEAVVITNNTIASLVPVVEVGLQSTHGPALDAISRNVAAVQLTGVGGNVAIYRR